MSWITLTLGQSRTTAWNSSASFSFMEIAVGLCGSRGSRMTGSPGAAALDAARVAAKSAPKRVSFAGTSTISCREVLRAASTVEA